MILAQAWPGFFLVGDDASPQICCWEPSCGLMQMFIEDDLLHATCVDSLLRSSALRFARWQDAADRTWTQGWLGA